MNKTTDEQGSDARHEGGIIRRSDEPGYALGECGQLSERDETTTTQKTTEATEGRSRTWK
jgi:hypothetical protein